MSSANPKLDVRSLLERAPCDRLLLDALCCLSSATGLVLVLQLVASAFELYTAKRGAPRAAEWAAVARSLLDRLVALERDQGIATLRTAPNVPKPTVYSLLAQSGRSTLSDSAREAALLLLADLVLEACHRKTRLHTTDITAWATLWRALGNKRLAEDWHVVAKNPPTTLADIHAALEAARTGSLRNLLQAAARSLAVDIPAVVREGFGSDGNVSGCEPGEANASPNPPPPPAAPPAAVATTSNSAKGDEDDVETRRNPVGWKWVQAARAEHSQLFDLVSHRDRLAPIQMQRTFKKLAVTFDRGSNSDKDLVVFSHLSARAGLPSKILLDLPIGPEGPVWIDRERHHLVWDFNTALRGLPQSAEARTSTVLLRLDVNASKWLGEMLKRNVFATRLRHCMGVSEDEQEQDLWLDRYRGFLRGHGDEDHPAYDARFAYSLGDVYREVTGNEALAPLMALDFVSTPTSLLHYITFRAAYVDETERAVFSYLGWTCPQELYPLPTAGASIWISPEHFSAGWSTLQQEAADCRARVETAKSAVDLVEQFNKLSDCRLASFVALTGHRGSLLHKLSWRALFLHAKSVQIFDKDVGEKQSRRHLPVTHLLAQVLAAWRDDFDVLEQQAKRFRIPLQTKAHRALGIGAAGEAFCHIRLGHSEGVRIFERARSGKSRLAALFEKHFHSPTNIGRHFWVSELLMRGASTWLVRALTGHYRRHAELHSDGMLHPPVGNLKRLREALDSIARELALCAPGGYSQGPADDWPMAVEAALPPAIHLRKDERPIAAPLQVLPPAFDAWTPVALRIGDEARALLSRECIDDPATDLTVSLLWFGLFDIDDQGSILQDWPNCRSPEAGVALASWLRPHSAQRITLPLVDACVLAGARVPTDGPIDVLAAMRLAGAWHRARFPKAQWPKDDLEAYCVAAALMLRWRRYHMPPALLTAGSPEMPSATFDTQSLLRLVADPDTLPRNDSSLGFAVRVGPPRTRALHVDALEEVAQTLRDVAKDDPALGKDRARAATWESSLRDVPDRGDTRADILRAMMHEEAALIQKNDPEKDKINTLYGYLSDQLDALQLLDPGTDVEQFTPDDFKAWSRAAKVKFDQQHAQTVAVTLGEPRYFGFKRLLKIGSRLGWEVPRGLWSDGGSRSAFDGYRTSAASVLVLSRDVEVMRSLVAEHFANWRAAQQDALTSLDLHLAAPLRTGARTSMSTPAVFKEQPAIRVGTGAFNRDKSARGDTIVSISDDVHARLLESRQRQEAAAEELMVTRDGTVPMRAITEALTSAGVQCTGSARFREHSLRASNAGNRLWPGWEPMGRAMLRGEGTPARCREFMKSLEARPTTSINLAARDCQHSRASITLGYYSAAWPLLWSMATQALLADLEPSGARVRAALGETGSLRNARSAAATNGQTFSTWRDAARRIVLKQRLPILQSHKEAATVVPRRESAEEAGPTVADAVLFVALRIAGDVSPRRADDLGIPDSFAKPLRAVIPGTDEKDVLLRRVRGKASKEQLERDRDLLLNSTSLDLRLGLASQNSEALEALLTDLTLDASRRMRRPLVGSRLADRLAGHLAVLPESLALYCRFAKRHEAPLSDEDVAGLGDRFILGKPVARLGPIPRILVVPSACTSEADVAAYSEAAGRWTVVTRLLCKATLLTLHIMKGPNP